MLKVKYIYTITWLQWKKATYTLTNVKLATLINKKENNNANFSFKRKKLKWMKRLGKS